MESLLEEKYLKEIKEFYNPYFNSTREVDNFIEDVFKQDWDDRKPRQMLFQVQRFVTLANEIDKIRPARDGLRMLFLKCCMESLAKLAGMDNLTFPSAFAISFSKQGEEYILSNFSLSYYVFKTNGVEHENSYDLNVNDFLLIIRAMRNMVVHDGNYWGMQMFAYDSDSTWLTHIETIEEIIPKSIYPNKEKNKTTYYFETTLQYNKFIFYFVEACVNFINEYVKKKEVQRHEKL